ncbi:MAG TPA: hypothetical protein P5567_11455 [Kiritimatiellia bacterium]|nr:hypothetical protein [Kiritimatiellia bacterium]HSA17476.1 hypothetical protein [Kiritimatiellia bacterium]
MKKNAKSSKKQEQPAPTIAELAKQDPSEGFETRTDAAPRLYAEEVRAHGPVYRGRGILPGWAIAMTTREGTPVSRVYKVYGSIKARALALAMCRQHRIRLNFAPVNG